jgi:hypothetical protein
MSMRGLVRSVGAALGVVPRAVPLAEGPLDPEVQTVLDAILATGASRAEAWQLLGQGLGWPRLLLGFTAELRALGDDWGRVTAVLAEFAQVDGTLAQAGLLAWGRNRRLPGDLDARGITWLVALPDGLTVEGNLWMNQTPLNRLPDGLKVGGWLCLRGCCLWDGRVPRGTRIGTLLFTDEHPDGQKLSAWRSEHPKGERPEMVAFYEEVGGHGTK